MKCLLTVLILLANMAVQAQTKETTGLYKKSAYLCLLSFSKEDE